MIGCFADALDHDIVVDGEEIVAARWFDRPTVRRLLTGETLDDVKLPRPEAIAFHLIRGWVEGA